MMTYPAPLTLPLLDAVSLYGTVLGFFRKSGLSAAMSFLVFDKRVRGLIWRLSPAREAAIASALVAAASPAAQPLLSWSNGSGWRTSVPAFNEFPQPYVPVVAPSSASIPAGPANRPYLSFVQSTPAVRWTIAHNLAGDPSVTAFDQNSTPIQGEVTYWPGLVVIAFDAAAQGFAYLV